jgi:mRNA interferase MazF
MKRGDVYWASLVPRSGSEQRGHRPIVVVSNDAFNEIASWRSLIVVPLTTSLRQAARGPTVVELPSQITGLPKTSYALCHQITTLDRSKLDDRVGRLGTTEMAEIAAGIVAACDLEE